MGPCPAFGLLQALVGGAESFVGGLLSPVGAYIGGVVSSDAGSMLGESAGEFLGSMASRAVNGAISSVISGGDPVTGALNGALGGAMGGVTALMGATHGVEGAIIYIIMGWVWVWLGFMPQTPDPAFIGWGEVLGMIIIAISFFLALGENARFSLAKGMPDSLDYNSHNLSGRTSDFSSSQNLLFLSPLRCCQLHWRGSDGHQRLFDHFIIERWQQQRWRQQLFLLLLLRQLIGGTLVLLILCNSGQPDRPTLCNCFGAGLLEELLWDLKLHCLHVVLHQQGQHQHEYVAQQQTWDQCF